MGVTQYIGARYVPIFADPAEWNKTRTYEPLTIVLHEGNSYTSKQFVPKGIDINNEEFWAETGNYNAQVEAYRQEVLRFTESIKENADNIEKNKNKISDFIQPEFFGAIGDGITDDSEAFKNTVDFALNNDVKIQLMANKTYLTDIDVSLNNKQKIVFDGNNSTIIPKSKGIYIKYNGQWADGAEDSVCNIIKNIEFDIQRNDSTCIIIDSSSFQYSPFPFIIENITVRQNYKTANAGEAIQIKNTNGIRIINCSFIGTGTGRSIGVYGGINHFVNKCNFFNVFCAVALHQNNYALEGLIFTDNLVLTANYGIYTAEQTGTRIIIGITVANNMIDQIKNSGLHLGKGSTNKICNNYIGLSANATEGKEIELISADTESYLQIIGNTLAGNGKDLTAAIYFQPQVIPNLCLINGNTTLQNKTDIVVTNNGTGNIVSNNIFARTLAGNVLCTNSDFASWVGNRNNGSALQIKNNAFNYGTSHPLLETEQISLEATFTRTNNTQSLWYLYYVTKDDNQNIDTYFGAQADGKKLFRIYHSGQVSSLIPWMPGETINISASQISKFQSLTIYRN